MPAESVSPGPGWLHNASGGLWGCPLCQRWGWGEQASLSPPAERCGRNESLPGQSGLFPSAGGFPGRRRRGLTASCCCCWPGSCPPPGAPGCAGSAEEGQDAYPLRPPARQQHPRGRPLTGSGCCCCLGQACCLTAPGVGTGWESDPGFPHPPSFSSSLSFSSSVLDPPLFSSFSSCGRSPRGFLETRERQMSWASSRAGQKRGQLRQRGAAPYLGGQDPGCGSACACACSSSWAAGCASAGTAQAAGEGRWGWSGRAGHPQAPPPPVPAVRPPALSPRGSPGQHGGGSPSAWCR